jgi:hypothetical protein
MPTATCPFEGLPAAATLEQSILLAQLQIVRRLEATRAVEPTVGGGAPRRCIPMQDDDLERQVGRDSEP